MKMTRWIAGFALSLFVMTAFHLGGSAWASDQPNILIMGEDADEDTVPRHSRIFNRVALALQSHMQERGFTVFDETAATMDVTNPARVRRSDAELITVARAISTPINVIVPFQIYAFSQDNAYSDIKELKIRVVGRLIEVNTGKALGNFEVSVGPRGLRPLPVNCDRDCVLEHVGDESKIVANEVALILADKMRNIVASPAAASEASAPAGTAKCDEGLATAYMIVIKDVAGEDIRKIEDMLVSFPGYKAHRPIRSQSRYTELWYETCSDRARLQRNVQSMVEMFPGTNRVALSANQFEIQHVMGTSN